MDLSPKKLDYRHVYYHLSVVENLLADQSASTKLAFYSLKDKIIKDIVDKRKI